MGLDGRPGFRILWLGVLEAYLISLFLPLCNKKWVGYLGVDVRMKWRNVFKELKTRLKAHRIFSVPFCWPWLWVTHLVQPIHSPSNSNAKKFCALNHILVHFSFNDENAKTQNWLPHWKSNLGDLCYQPTTILSHSPYSWLTGGWKDLTS